MRSVQGSSTIGCIVDEAGIPYDLVVVKPLGMGLDEMAALAVSRYRFTPATKDGQKVRVWINVQYNFRNR
jgi:TonB family protein